MNPFLEAIILGIVQGITEWLPVSSSGHLMLAHQLLGLKQPVVYDIILHLGSLLVVFGVFWKDISKIVSGVLKKDPFFLKYLGLVILGTIPIGLVGFFFKQEVEAAFNNVTMLGISFLMTAAFLFLSRYPSVKENVFSKKSALLVGIAQAIAILPGVSRSGATISAGLMQGIKREEAARFSFLLFIPAILGATILELPSLGQVENIPALLLGTVVTMVVGWFSLTLLLKIIKHQKFHYFGWYCLGLGLLVLFV